MKDENNLYWIWLSEKFGIASKDFPRFAEKYDDPYDVYRLENDEIEQLEGVSERLKTRLSEKSLEGAYSILKYCRKYGIEIIGYSDKRYPSRLKTIENPPVLLYCLGKLPNMDSRLCIGMVGTRKMSEYGKQTAYKISYELGASNVCVVSGMALGVDGVCACGALESGGVTVAVLGCGISITYPKEHAKLMRAISKQGAVITEYPPFERPNPGNFPKRNRIISGLCQGVLVVEGAKGSGALITASRAISQGRELFALPGKINESNSEGPNDLIKNGANVALSATDIINHYDFLYHDTIDYRGLSWARKRSEFDEKILKKYGVSSVYYRGRYVPAEEKRQTAETEFELSSAEPAVVEPPKNQPVPAKADRSEAIFESLDDSTKKIFGLIPDGVMFTPDAVSAHGIDIGEVITALTMLEISGLVASLPGGLYIKK
ncbi:MAG: DNA-processing protein DprA [Clostridia bacterium]|nr:DNA-processing protein DprA [Clostridia bacterium]